MPLWDEKIELTEAELLQNREGYEERMKKERREMRAKQRRFEAANLVHSMMQGMRSSEDHHLQVIRD